MTTVANSLEKGLIPEAAVRLGIRRLPDRRLASEEARHKSFAPEWLDTLCQKLNLKPGDHLLEIGTGWGSMAIHAAENYGCRVTTTTISSEQFNFSQKKVAKAGLQDQVTVLLKDYRDLDGRFDHIVSVQMIEAIGAEYHDTFYRKCDSLLNPGGRFVMQVITMTDQICKEARKNADFIRRYIFPGSCISSVTALVSSATRASGMGMRDIEDITPHYARTLAEWRENLAPHREEVVARYGEQFWRMWHYYLCCCEAGFSEHYIGSHQLLFEKSRCAR